MSFSHRTTTISSGCYVNSLPPELLSQIFLALERDELERLNSGWKPPTWIFAAGVCKYWRQVALECAELWSNITFEWPQLIDIQLERSRGIPLSIYFDHFRTATATKKFNEILADPKIVGALTIGFSAYEPVNLQVSLASLSATAPVLEKLSIVGSDGTFDRYAGVEIDNVPEWYDKLPQSFRMGGAPSLTHLDLVYLDIAWENVPLSPSITSLRLVSGPDPQGLCRPTRDLFLASITHLPFLEDLTLKSLLPIIDFNGIIQAVTPTALDRLVSLSLTDTTASITYFLKQFRLPNAAKVTFGICHEEPNKPALLLEQCIVGLKKSWERGPFQVGWNEVEVESFAVLPSPEAGDRTHLSLFAHLAFKQTQTAFDLPSGPNIWPWGNPPAISVTFTPPLPFDSSVAGCLEKSFNFTHLARHGIYLDERAKHWVPHPGPTITTTKLVASTYRSSLKEISFQGECQLDTVLQILQGPPGWDDAQGPDGRASPNHIITRQPYFPSLRKLSLVVVKGDEDAWASLVEYLKNRGEGTGWKFLPSICATVYRRLL